MLHRIVCHSAFSNGILQQEIQHMMFVRNALSKNFLAKPSTHPIMSTSDLDSCCEYDTDNQAMTA